MIHVDRGRVPVPTVLASSRAVDARQQAREFFERPYADWAQQRFEWDTALLGETVEPLLTLFQHKCAYCETPIDSSWVEVDNFRPRQLAVNLDGTVSPPHYWWLAYEWFNLYPACPTCCRMKGGRFPVEGSRAPALSDQSVLRDEGHLVLDPCDDDPALHLVFNDDGTVASSTRRGQVTIEVLGLNRTDMVETRAAEARRLRSRLDLLANVLEAGRRLSDEVSELPQVSLQHEIEDARRFAALRRQVAARWLADLPRDLRGRLADRGELPTILAVDERARDLGPLQSQVETVAQFQDFQRSLETYSLKSAVPDEAYYIKTRLIERIELKNFRNFERLSLELKGRTANMPWLMLLGENGTGKSSILQAVGLALAGDEYRRELASLVSPAIVLRHGSRSGYVRLYLTGVPDPLELRFRRGSSSFTASAPEPKILVLGYGATRLLPHSQAQPRPGRPYSRIDNLFDPFVPLKDAEQWLLGLAPDAFAEVARDVVSLLPIEDEVHLEQELTPPRIAARIADDSMSITQLSTGYQSVLALACDIMAVMLDRWSAMESAEGIVILDEIGAHLHPRWKMRIVDSLRRVFPRIQFLVSTHDPLCLQDTLPGEVYVLDRDPQTKAVVANQVDVPPGLRADQLLTGWWFKLPSTLDQGTRDLMDEHRKLLVAEQTPKVRQNAAEIEAELRRRLGGFGETDVERLAIGAAAQIMAEEHRELGPQERADVRQKILERVQATRRAKEG